MSPRLLFDIAWAGWIISWIAAAAWSNRAEKRVGGRDAWTYRIVLTAGAVMLWPDIARAVGAQHLWYVGYTGAYALAALTFAGIFFAWWARIHLGRLWSSSVTRKEGHVVIETGPYALVRHPIYTGMLLSTGATAAALATWTAICGFALLAAGFWLKASLEERFLAAELDPGAYNAYRNRIPMLIPFLPTNKSPS